MPGRILLLASGTLGDVLPYAALARGLTQHGLPAAVATHARHLADLEARGVPGVLLGENPNDLLDRPGAMPLTFNGDPLGSLRRTFEFLRAARPVFGRLLESAAEAARGARAVVVGLPTTWGHSLGEALGAPVIWCPLQPLSPTRRFPSALQPFGGSLGPAYNRLTYLAVEQAIWQVWRGEINRWRVRRLGLRPLPAEGPFRALRAARTPFIYGLSPHVLPRPDDWPPEHVLAGYWHPDMPDGWRPPPALEGFLGAGEPPVYVGFGSMRQAPRLRQMVVQALAASGLRAVMALGPGDADLPSNVFDVGDVPHGWLFPRLRAALHHGGAGTTAASLRAGLPTAIAPVGVDQFFWGERVWRLGLGPRPVPQRSLTPVRLQAMLQALVDDAGLRARAGALGEKLRAEDGVGRAVELIAAAIASG